MPHTSRIRDCLRRPSFVDDEAQRLLRKKFDASFGVWTAVNQIANEDNPAMLVVGQGSSVSPGPRPVCLSDRGRRRSPRLDLESLVRREISDMNSRTPDVTTRRRLSTSGSMPRPASDYPRLRPFDPKPAELLPSVIRFCHRRVNTSSFSAKHSIALS